MSWAILLNSEEIMTITVYPKVADIFAAKSYFSVLLTSLGDSLVFIALTVGLISF